MRFRNQKPIKSKTSPKLHVNIQYRGKELVEKDQAKKINIFAQVADRIVSNRDQSYQHKHSSNSFGLSPSFLKRYDPYDERFIVVFMQDGQEISKAKAFRYNLIEKLDAFGQTVEANY